MAVEADQQPSRSYLPIRTWLPQYSRAWLRPDVVAALTTWALVVPQAIAYGQLAGLPAQAGLYTAFAALLAYGIFGTSRHLVVSPTSSTAIVSAALIAPMAMGDAGQFASLSAMLAILVGAVFIIYGLLKLGFVSQFIATSVQVGMMFGLGLTIIATQIPKLLGIPGGEGTFVDQVGNILRNLDQTNLTTLALGVTCLAALLLLKRFAPRFPAALAVVVGSILVVTFLNLGNLGVEVIGRIDTSVPLPAVPRVGFSEILTLLGGAVIISLIGYAESDTVAEQFAVKHRYEIYPNQELVGLGAANVAAGLFQGFIVAGGASQTAASESAGAKSQLSNLIVSGLVLLTVVALMPLFSNLAQAVLGAIVIAAVISFINVPAMKRIYHLRHDSFALAVVALLGVLILGVLPGLILAMLISVVLILINDARPEVSTLGALPDQEGYASVERNPEAQSIPGLLIIRPEASLMAFNAKHIRKELLDRVRAKPDTRVVLLDLETNSDLDVEGLDTLGHLLRELKLQDVELWLARVRGPVSQMLDRADLTEQIGLDHLFTTVDQAVDSFNQLPEAVPKAVKA